KGLTKEGVAFVGKTISTYVLEYGGAAFIIAGAAILAFPQILNFGIITPLKVHNLHDLGVGFFIVIVVVVVIGLIGYKIAVKEAVNNPRLVRTQT
ncbi:MAG: hypothetical protein QXQ46_09810, partial [Thermoplasmatales archaeon]